MTEPWNRANTDWLREAKWGTMTHYLADAASNRNAVNLTTDDWNRRIDSVNVDRLAEQIAQTGAGYHILTLGQNSGFFCAPNETYDAIVGTPSKLSRRDLLGELAAALGNRGVRTLAYLPSHAPALDRRAVEALKFTPAWDMSGTGIIPGTYISAPGVDARLTEALQNWEAVIRDWSVRWGPNVSGWWFDGCYYADKIYRHADEPNFRSFAQSAKAGNPEAIVAFNPGVKVPVISMTEYEDYTAGEINDFWIGNKWEPLQRYIRGAQLHVLSFLGRYWGEGPARITPELAAAYTNHVSHHEGVVTWDIPISREGQISDEFREDLGRIGRLVNEMKA